MEPQIPQKNFKDPFSAGQMIGMLTMLCYIQKRGRIERKELEEIMQRSASSVQEYFNKPTEDIILMVDQMTKEIK